MTIGQRIRDLRAAKHWSLFELSQKSGVREQTLRSWEDDRRRSPDAFMLAKVAAALETTTDFLITGVHSEAHETLKAAS